jgi:hypothetical protein
MGSSRRGVLTALTIVSLLLLTASPALAADHDEYPGTVVVQAGVGVSGDAGSLTADDGEYFITRSSKPNVGTTSWYGEISDLPDDSASLTVAYQGKASATCTQSISIFRWTDTTWVQLDSRSIGTAEIAIGNLTPPGSPSDFVSAGPGSIGFSRVRVTCTTGGSTQFSLSGELMKITVSHDLPDHTLTVIREGTGSGTVRTTAGDSIDCGQDCTESYVEGRIVYLEATPDNSSTFTGWTDCPEVIVPLDYCRVDMSADIVVTATFSLVGGDPGEHFPASFTVETGAYLSGSAGSLGADDDDYLTVRSTKTGVRVAAWYGTFTGVDDAVASLSITYRGGIAFGPCTQVISIFRWTDSMWIELNSRTADGAEFEIANLSPPGSPSDYVSGSSGAGDVRVRVACSDGPRVFQVKGELLKLTTPP